MFTNHRAIQFYAEFDQNVDGTVSVALVEWASHDPQILGDVVTVPDEDWIGAEQMLDRAYQAFLDEMAAMCHRPYVCGPAHDPYGTSCHLVNGHIGPHVGADPFVPGELIAWFGGGHCAGDPLPQHVVPVPE